VKTKYSKWEIFSRYPKDPIKEILKQRQVKDIENFLNPKYETLSPSHSIQGLKVGVERIRKALKNKEKIAIFADYDADGICGGAIVYRALKILGDEPEYYVPERLEGYGLSQSAVEKLKHLGISLLITVDCGISNDTEIAHAKKLGIDTIVVDHHQCPEKLPDAVAIIHPKVGHNVCFEDFSGGGVAYLLARSLLRERGLEKWLIDLAAISTVADVVPLLGDNRTIVKYGLLVINKTKNLGLKYLIQVAGLAQVEIGTYEIGFMIAPRINAAGRIAKPRESFELLVTDDKVRAKDLAEKLNDLNIRRQKMLDAAQEEAIKMVQSKKLDQRNLIILRGSWSEGIVGLISGKVTEYFHRPSIVLSEGKDILKGSARSIEGVNITDLIAAAKRHIKKFGGHTMAAGLSIEKDKFKDAEEALLRQSQKIDSKLLERVLKIDCLLDEKLLNIDFVDKLEKLKPFGVGNPKPTFALSGAEIISKRAIGRDKNHVRFEFKKGYKFFKGIFFDFAEENYNIQVGDVVDLAFSVKLDIWQGRKKIDLILEDVKKIK